MEKFFYYNRFEILFTCISCLGVFIYLILIFLVVVVFVCHYSLSAGPEHVHDDPSLRPQPPPAGDRCRDRGALDGQLAVPAPPRRGRRQRHLHLHQPVLTHYPALTHYYYYYHYHYHYHWRWGR